MLGGVLSLALVATATAAPAPRSIRVTATRGVQPLALLSGNTPAYVGPNRDSRLLVIVNPKRPLTGEQTALPLLARVTRANGERWLRVLLPGRPNSHSGWILARRVTIDATKWQITVSLGARRVTVRDHGRVVRSFAAVVGKPSTPTPTGHFFVEETLRLYPQGVGAPYALALSARSNVLQEFDGGPGQIALHGTANIGGTLGSAESHGCMRLDTASITWLGDHIGPGVPVTISA